MIIYDLPSELLDVDARLHNWGRWARERSRQGRARSAEGRHVPKGGDDEDRRTPQLAVDIFDASIIDGALAPARGFPKRESMVLKGLYVERLSENALRRRMCIHRDDFPLVVLYAMRMVRNRLARIRKP